MSKPTAVSARTLLSFTALTALGSLATQAMGALGSFSPNEGYNLNVFTGSYNWSDVSYYNAGGYGVNAGGGPGPTPIAPDSGKWRVVGGVGGYFGTAAARNTATAGAPAYPGVAQPGMIPVYLVGDHGPGRTDNSSLAFRNDTAQGSTGPAVYDYALDTYDTGGPVPASVTGGVVNYSIYFSTSPNDPFVPGVRSQERFTQSVLDSAGNIGMQWGYARDNTVLWRTSPSGLWNYTGIIANAGNWDRISVDIDLSSDTFKLDYFDSVASTWSNLAPAGTLLGTTMGNFTGLRWQLEDGTNGGVGGKNFFDDATFKVPAPGAALMVGAGVVMAARRRRR
jgi:hypothetical protein